MLISFAYANVFFFKKCEMVLEIFFNSKQKFSFFTSKHEARKVVFGIWSQFRCFAMFMYSLWITKAEMRETLVELSWQNLLASRSKKNFFFGANSCLSCTLLFPSVEARLYSHLFTTYFYKLIAQVGSRELFTCKITY
jgi:hypothetical protein